MSMSKQDFIGLADYISSAKHYCEPFTDKQIEHLANFCHQQNPRFMRNRWIEYINGRCGPGGGKVKSLVRE